MFEKFYCSLIFYIKIYVGNYVIYSIFPYSFKLLHKIMLYLLVLFFIKRNKEVKMFMFHFFDCFLLLVLSIMDEISFCEVLRIITFLFLRFVSHFFLSLVFVYDVDIKQVLLTCNKNNWVLDL